MKMKATPYKLNNTKNTQPHRYNNLKKKQRKRKRIRNVNVRKMLERITSNVTTAKFGGAIGAKKS